MKFITDVTGPPLSTAKPLRCGSYNAIVTSRGFVIADPAAFDLPDLDTEIMGLPHGTGFVRGHLHLFSRNFPMYFPESSPPLLLASKRLMIMPLQDAPDALRTLVAKQVPADLLDETPEAGALMNVLPGFDIYRDGAVLSRA